MGYFIRLDYFIFEVPLSERMLLGMVIIVITNIYVLKKSTAKCEAYELSHKA